MLASEKKGELRATRANAQMLSYALQRLARESAMIGKHVTQPLRQASESRGRGRDEGVGLMDDNG